jgi:hypothetical protein
VTKVVKDQLVTKVTKVTKEYQVQQVIRVEQVLLAIEEKKA